MEVPKSANHVTCAVHIQFASADFVGAGLYAVDHGGKRNAVCEKLVGIKLHLVLLHIAADAGDLRNSRYGLQLITKLPVLQTAPIGQTVPVACIDNRILIN